jgi:amino-acid N-acetyltransferase
MKSVDDVAAGVAPLIRPARRADLGALQELLAAASLPPDGVVEWLSQFVVAEHEGALVGAAGVETYADGSLLRSVVISPAWQGRGLGRALVDAALSSVAARGRDVYLLTTTAEPWFPRFGFERITREQVPFSVQESVEFREACPATAVVMLRRFRHREVPRSD